MSRLRPEHDPVPQLSRGIADAEAGRVVPLDEAFRRLRAELKLSGEGA